MHVNCTSCPSNIDMGCKQTQYHKYLKVQLSLCVYLIVALMVPINSDSTSRRCSDDSLLVQILQGNNLLKQQQQKYCDR